MYAVIETGGKQYKVEEGDVIRVEKLEGEVESSLKIEKVLLVVDGEDIKVGTPYLDGGTVEVTKVKDDKAEKLIVYKFRRRKDSEVKRGHRQQLTVLKIDKIVA